MRAKLQDLLRRGERELKKNGIADFRADAFCLLNKQFGVNRAQILLAGEAELPDEKVRAYEADLRARAAHTPLQHLLGSREFMGLPFAVNPNVLIPRPETEWLAEYVITRYAGRPARVLDLCTGSGCVGIAIKKLLPQAEVTLLDVSKPALAVAEQNAQALGVQVKIEAWDLLQGVPFYLRNNEYDVLVCNPPYIKTADLPALEPEVRREPRLALDGGEDGLLYYRALARDWSALLAPGGELIVETGDDTGEAVRALFAEALAESTLHRDLAGLPRYVTAKKMSHTFD